jgi:hypothetical protein
MVAPDQIAKRFLIVGVAIAAVRPRMPFDKPFSVGGRLSNGFRKLLLGIVAVNFSRLFLSGEGELGLFSDLLGVVEVTGLTVLCFLTPYILETKLTNFIHVRPGRSFYVPLTAAAVLSFLGVVLSRTIHPNLWCLKKLANAVSGPPVIMILRQFNLVTTARAHGNGFMVGQATLSIEYWYLWLQIACAIGYGLDRHVAEEDANGWDDFLQAARSVAFMGDWTRVLMHALFLNGIDEMNHLNVFRGGDEEDQQSSRATGSETIVAL